MVCRWGFARRAAAAVVGLAALSWFPELSVAAGEIRADGPVSRREAGVNLDPRGRAETKPVKAASPVSDAPASPGSAPQAPDPSSPPPIGDTIESPFRIESLPFTGAGNTCEFVDDYDASCPFGAQARDVVYAYTAPTLLFVNVDLCASFYDTKLFVYRGSVASLVGCSDDVCGADGYKSRLAYLELDAGETYYFVVDGYDAACGTYTMAVTTVIPTQLECPPGAFVEHEPVCGDGYVDLYNGGCCCSPVVRFTDLESGPDTLHVCGQSGSFMSQGEFSWDTDWYEINPQDATRLTYCGTAEFSFQLVLIDGREGCGGYAPLEVVTGLPFQERCLTRDIEPGKYWLWVGPMAFTPAPCGSDYVLTIGGYHSGGSAAPEGVPEPRSPFGLTSRPQPFAARTTLYFELPAPSSVRLAVYRPDGRHVRTLVHGDQPQGPGEVSWDALDGAGREVASGTYYCVLEVAGDREVRSVTLLR